MKLKDKKKLALNSLLDKHKDDIRHLNRTRILALFFWIIIIITSLAWNIFNEKHQILSLARLEALSNFNKNFAFRQWAAEHGGVYVPPDDKTPPNPALSHIPDRDIVSNFGKKYTLMNPAYILRQLMQEYSELYGIKGHITSFKLLNPNNAPDEWEKKVLMQFENGTKEVSEISLIDGNPYLRLMKPLTAEKACLKCHAFQGYKAGDVRGGLSVSVPMKPYYLMLKKNITILVFSHALFLLLGLFGINLFFKHNKLRVIEHANEEEKLQIKSHELEASSKDLETYNYITYHNMRTPLVNLTAFSGELNYCINEIKPLINKIIRDENITDDEKQRLIFTINKDMPESLNFIISSSLNINNMMKALSKLIYIGKAELKKELLDANEIIRLILQDFAQQIETLDIKITVAPLHKIFADRLSVEQIIGNLIDNAIKYRDDDRQLCLEISSEQKDSEIIFYFKDNGIGVDEDKTEKIFDIYYRASIRDIEGYGMGLAYSRTLINRHGGKMWCKSIKGSGTTFMFSCGNHWDN